MDCKKAGSKRASCDSALGDHGEARQGEGKVIQAHLLVADIATARERRGVLGAS